MDELTCPVQGVQRYFLRVIGERAVAESSLWGVVWGLVLETRRDISVETERFAPHY